MNRSTLQFLIPAIFANFITACAACGPESTDTDQPIPADHAADAGVEHEDVYAQQADVAEELDLYGQTELDTYDWECDQDYTIEYPDGNTWCTDVAPEDRDQYLPE